MAFVGARHGVVAKMLTLGDSTTAPTYEKAVSVGPLNKVDLSSAWNEGELYGDDVLQENYGEFGKGTATISSTSVPDDAEQIMDSYTYEENGDKHLAAPGGKADYGFAYISAKRSAGKTRYYSTFVPRLAPKYESETAETQGGTTTLNPESVQATWLKAPALPPKVVSPYFDTEAEAIAWRDEKLPLAAAGT